MKDEHKVARISQRVAKHKRDYKSTVGKQAEAQESNTRREQARREEVRHNVWLLEKKRTVTNLARIAHHSSNNV